jgi:uncharacterized protein YukE
MPFSGMDVDEVERLAARLDLQANAIAALVGVVDSAVAGLSGVWQGHDLDAFRGAWHQSHRPQAQAMTDRLAAWVAEVRRQAAEQRAVSGGSGASSGGLSGGIAAALGAPGVLAGLAGLADHGSEAIEILSNFSQNKWSIGRYPHQWESMLTQLSHHQSLEELLRYKKSPIFHFLNQNHGALEHGSTVLGIAGLAAGFVNTVSDVASHDYVSAGLDGSTTTASGLKSNDGTYLWGVALQSLTEAGEAARGVDWSAGGLQGTWDYIKSDPLGALDAGLSADIHEMPGHLLHIFT